MSPLDFTLRALLAAAQSDGLDEHALRRDLAARGVAATREEVLVALERLETAGLVVRDAFVWRAVPRDVLALDREIQAADARHNAIVNEPHGSEG